MPSAVLKPHDVIGFLGGANMVGVQESGHLEAQILASFHTYGLRFRNLAWEGDTVFSQPRDFNFPPTTNLLRRFEVSFLLLGFGQTECLQSTQHLSGFIDAYDRLIQQYQKQMPRIALLTPTPFESSSVGSPDLTRRAALLSSYVQGIRDLAARRGCLLIDVHNALMEPRRDFGGTVRRLTDNGMHLNAHGQAVMARCVARNLGAELSGKFSLSDDLVDGVWRGPMEQLRRSIVEKNRLWFDYWRPMNWAFLNGDRTEQPSSRDHMDPTQRWFPAEMEKFVPLLYRAETDINRLAASLSPSLH